MKKVLLGLISIILAGQVSFAQPVSDMAVIPMGITIQSVMRLNITKGGNMEFVFKNATELTNGIPPAFGLQYETHGFVTSSLNWDLMLTPDAVSFTGDIAGIIPLNVIEYDPTTPVVANTTQTAGTVPAASVASFPVMINTTGSSNRGSALEFGIQWACGATIGTGVIIPTATVAGRYSVNFILSLVPTATP